MNENYFLGSLGTFLGALIAATIFKKYVRKPSWKILYFFGLTILVAMLSYCTPKVTSFRMLIMVYFLRQMFGQMLEIPCQGMYVYTLGSKASQPFIMLFHCTVGFGFVLGPILISPFFPQESPSERYRVTQIKIRYFKWLCL